MRSIKYTLSTLFLVATGLSGVKAQDAINAAGGNASGSGGSTSYSVGQAVFTTNTGTGGSVSQGVQQAYAISVVSGIDEAITLTCTAFPNPTTDFLNLTIENSNPTASTILILDLNGKLLSKQQIEGNHATIPMEQYTVGTYFIRIMQHNTERKTFKIIKE